MGVGIIDNEQLCLVCGRFCKNRRSLGNHVARSHKEICGLQEYVLKLMLKSVVPKCKCGCESDVHWNYSFFKFNDYVNGHNHVFSSENQPIFTKDQIEQRNNAIRRSYVENGDEIKKKISTSVVSAFTVPEHHKNLVNARAKQWQDFEFREKHKEAQIKSWQGKAGDDRRERVFTPEFARKISQANMRRDNKKISIAETEFVSLLRNKGFVVETSKWFNFYDKTWCADVWLPELNAIVEFDGIYWHGLDRSENFTRKQLVNIVNDIKKNVIAREKKLTLFRIVEGTDLSCIEPSIESLTNVAFHVVIDGKVIKEGTFKFTSDFQTILSRESLIKINETEIFDDAPGREYTRTELLPVIKEFFRAYVAYWGWFYPTTSESIDSVLSELLTTEALGSKGDMLTRSNASSAWLKSHVRSYWNVDNGPVKSFDDDKRLASVLSYRLGLNNSKLYKYTLSNGQSVECRETFDINLKNIRTGFIVQKNAVSWFKPTWAVQVFKHFLSGISNPVVWDPSIGFGARMLGFSAVFNEGTYIGSDPAEQMCEDAFALANIIAVKKPFLCFDIRRSGSEIVELRPESIDLVFTSPPYFDREKYFDEPGQCWRDYPNFENWIEFYLIPTFQRIFSALKYDCFAVINIDDARKDVITYVAESVGLTFVDMMKIPTGRDHFNKRFGYNESGRYEPLLIFRKEIKKDES